MTQQASSPLSFSDGQLEALKWIALASMFLDHFGRHLLGWGQDTWVFALGRIAFPLFALVLALNLAREGDRAARAARTARGSPYGARCRCCPRSGRGVNRRWSTCWAHWAWARPCAGPSPARRLWPGALWSAWPSRSRRSGSNSGLPGVFVIPAIYLWCTQRQPEAALLALVFFLLTVWLNTSFGGWAGLLGTLAVLPIAWGVSRLAVSVPRLQLAFYLVYPLHLALIGALKA